MKRTTLASTLCFVLLVPIASVASERVIEYLQDPELEEAMNEVVSITAEGSFSCNTYSEPGTYTLKECDKIERDGFELEVRFVDQYKGIFWFKKSFPNGFVYNRIKHLNSTGFKSFNASTYMASYGAFVNVESSNGSEVQLSVYDSCQPILDICEQQTEPKPVCEALCDQGAQSSLDYLEQDGIEISAPKEYARATSFAIQNAINCKAMIESKFGFESQAPVRIAYRPDTNSGCHKGNYKEKVLCNIHEAWADENVLEHANSISLDLVQLQHSLAEGACITMNDSPFQSMAHEMAHFIATYHFPRLNTFFSEGLARYIDQNYDIVPEIPLTSKATLVCEETGSYHQISPTWATPLQPYEEVDTGTYNSGACFLFEVENQLGSNVLTKLIEHGMAAEYCPEKGHYYLFKEFLNPVLGLKVEDFPQFFPSGTDPKKMSGCF